jgi:hypothetical protein
MYPVCTDSRSNQPLHLTAPGRARARPCARWYCDSRVPQVSGNALDRRMMPSDEYSFRTLGSEVLSWTWPAFVGFAGAQVVLVRQALARARLPAKWPAFAMGAASICAVAIGVDAALGFATAPKLSPGFAQMYWPIIWPSSWPVLAVFAGPQVLLVVFARSRSRVLLTALLLAAGFTASWMVAFWLFVGPHTEPLLRSVLPRPWVLGVLAGAFGSSASTAVWLIVRRLAFGKGKTDVAV